MNETQETSAKTSTGNGPQVLTLGSEMDLGLNPWLPAYGYHMPHPQLHHGHFQPVQEESRANDAVLVQQVEFLETILEETSDDLQSDSDHSGTTYWLGSDSETESVIHIRSNHADEKPDGSGSECNSVVPKKRRRKDPVEGLNATIHCDENDDDDNEDQDLSSSSRSSSLLQFESLERTCATGTYRDSPSSYSFDSLEFSSRSNTQFENTSPDSLEARTTEPEHVVPNCFNGTKDNGPRVNGFARIRPFRSFESLDTCQKEEDQRQVNSFSLYSEESRDFRARDTRIFRQRDFWHDVDDDNNDDAYSGSTEDLNDIEDFEDRSFFGDGPSGYASSLDFRNTIDLREIGIETKKDALFDLKSGQAATSAALLQSGLNIASGMSRNASQQGWSKPRFNFRITDKSQSVPSLSTIVFAPGFVQPSSTCSVASLSQQVFENYTQVSSVPVNLHLCGTTVQDAPADIVDLTVNDMADFVAQDDATSPPATLSSDEYQSPVTTVRTQDAAGSNTCSEFRATSTVKTQDKMDWSDLSTMENDIDAVVDEAIKQFKREVEEASVADGGQKLKQRPRSFKNNASYELAQQFEVDEKAVLRMPSCEELEEAPRPAPRRRVQNNASYELAQQFDYIKAVTARPFQRMNACDELEEPGSSTLKVTDLVEEMSRNYSTGSAVNLARENSFKAPEPKTYSKSSENISERSKVVQNHVDHAARNQPWSPVTVKTASPKLEAEQDSLLSQIKKNSDFFSIYGESASNPSYVADEIEAPTCFESKPLDDDNGILNPHETETRKPSDKLKLNVNIVVDNDSNDSHSVSASRAVSSTPNLHKMTFINDFYPDKKSANVRSAQDVRGEDSYDDLIDEGFGSVREEDRLHGSIFGSHSDHVPPQESSGSSSATALPGSAGKRPRTDSGNTSAGDADTSGEWQKYELRDPPDGLRPPLLIVRSGDGDGTTTGGNADVRGVEGSAVRDMTTKPSRSRTDNVQPLSAQKDKVVSGTEKKKGLGGFLQRFSRLRFSGRSKVPRSEVSKKDDGRGKVQSKAVTGGKDEPDYIIIPLHPPEGERKGDILGERRAKDGHGVQLERSGSSPSSSWRPPVSTKPPLPPQPPRAATLGAKPPPGPRRRATTDLGNPGTIEMAKARTMQAANERPVGLLETDLDATSDHREQPDTCDRNGTQKTRSLLNLNQTRVGPAGSRALHQGAQVAGGIGGDSDVGCNHHQRPHKSMEFLLDKENFHFVKPPENELQKVGERVPSEHELRVQRSLQRLNVPDWYKNSPSARDGFRLKRHSDASQHGGWRALGSKTTSLSSLLSSSKPCTVGPLLSPSPTPPVFSRWSTSLLNSAGSSPASSARSSFNQRQPYLGWRSQERLANPRTPAERLAQGILPNLQSANKHQTNYGPAQQLEVRNSIKEVTSAIVHYVQSGHEVGGRLSPRPDDWDDRGGARSISPRGSVKLCWMESSFVGSRPVDSPETPMSLATDADCCAGCNATMAESCTCVDSAASGLYLDLTPDSAQRVETSSLSLHYQQQHHRGSGASDTEEAVAAAALLRNKPSPGSTTLEDVLDSLLGLPPASRTPSPGPGSGPGPTRRPNTNAGKSCIDIRQDLQESVSTVADLGNLDDRPSYYMGELARRKSEGSDSLPSRGAAKSSLRHRRVSFDNTQENGAVEKLVRCRYNKCNNAVSTVEARRSYKSCHNCSYMYCSRECRRAHWERHRRTCLHSRAGTLCRQVLSAAKEDVGTLQHISALAKRGYASHGRGTVKCFFSSPEAAENFISNGFINLGEPTYVRWSDLLPSEMGTELYGEVMRLSKSYNPETRFVLYVAVCVVSEVPTSGAVKWERQLVSRCAKLRLDSSCRESTSTSTTSSQLPPRQTSPCNITREMDSPETLVLTSYPGSNGQNTPQRAREISFTNIQRQLRLRGVSLRRHFPQVYKKLCAYVDGSVDKFAPVTIYPRYQGSSKSFMCIIMLDAEPERLQLLPTDSSRVRTVDISIEQE